MTHYHPEWDIWAEFLHGETHKALDRDALKETVPIELPGGGHVVINASTAPILYNKGGSILRQVAGYIGESSFREGLRYYLRKHKYACASSSELWEALEEVSEKPATTMMKSWIEQPGHPLVEVARDVDKLVLTQRRFTYLPNESDQAWVIPVSIKIFYKSGDSQQITTLMTNKSTHVDISSNTVAYKANYGQSGFYRVKYREKDNLQELGKRILSKDLLPPEDRWGLQNDLYALVRSGDVSLDDYLNFLSYYKEEDNFLPLISIADNLFHAYLVLEGTQRQKVASVGKSSFEKVLSRIGYEPDRDTKHTTSILRDHILVHAVIYGSEDAAGFARDKFSSLMRGGSIHSDIMKSIMQVGALNGNRDTFTWFEKGLKSSKTEHERMNILQALGRFSDQALIKRTQQYILDQVPARNKFIPVDSLASNPHAIPSMWEWFVSNVSTLEQFHPIQYERIIEAIIPVCGIGKEKQVRAFFEAYMRQKTKAKDVIKMSLERLEVNSKMRAS